MKNEARGTKALILLYLVSHEMFTELGSEQFKGCKVVPTILTHCKSTYNSLVCHLTERMRPSFIATTKTNLGNFRVPESCCSGI